MYRFLIRRRYFVSMLVFLSSALTGLLGCSQNHNYQERDNAPFVNILSGQKPILRFYESSKDNIAFGKRKYKDTYRHDKTRRIYWELYLRCPPLEKNSLVKIQATWRFNETELVNVQTVILKLKKNATEAQISASWLPWTDVGWTPGRYTVECFANDSRIVSNHFRILSSNNYKPKQPARSPFFKLNTVNHHACLNEIEVDEDNKYLVTASNDKTVRLWDLKKCRLLRVLRPPIGNDEEGQLRTVAISPNGKVIACGGKTGKSWNMSFVVYVFDRAKAVMIQLLKGFPNKVQDIAFSKDGRFMVVFYGDGFRVYACPAFKLVDQHQISYRWITRADINSRNEIAVATFDGHLLIFAIVDNRIVQKATGTTNSGRRPISVKYSPDNKNLVVTFRDTKDIDIYSAKNITYLYSPICAGIERFLVSAVWSADGQYIYAGGVHEEYLSTEGQNEMTFPIFCWNKKGKGERSSIPIGNIGINTLRALNDGRIVYGLYDGSWGILNENHHKEFIQPSSILHFRKLRKKCRISPDASKVFFQYALNRNSEFIIDIKKGRVLPWTKLSGKEPMIYPRVHHPNVNIVRWKHKKNPRLDGKPLLYSPAEISRCLAIEDGGKRFILGTNRNIYCFNEHGEKLWRTKVSSVTRAVNISENNEIIVAHVGDGTIRWYRMKDGKEFLAFYPHPDRKRWIIWTPDGYYMCSPHGDNLIGWHLNNSKDKEADFFTALQFERLLYNPHYVKMYFEQSGNYEGAEGEGENLQFSISKLESILPPRITIIHPEPGFVYNSDNIRLKFNVERTRLPLIEYTVFVNNIPVTPAAERLIDYAQNRFDHEIDLSLHEEKIDVRIEARNGQSMGIAETHFYTTKAKPATKGDLYLLSVGINTFSRMPDNNLSFAVNDAEKIAERFLGEEGKAFSRVFIKTITDNSSIKPTKKEIINHLSFFKSAGPYDTSILFLASHGLSDNAGNYYLVPSDGAFSDIRNIVKTHNRGIKSVKAVTDSLIGWRSFFDIFCAIPGKRLLVVDTCHSQLISGTFNMYALAKRSASSSFALMTASKDNEPSQELPAIKHGLFTYALLKGLSGEGNMDNDHQIRLSELYGYAFDFVTMHYNARIGPQTPQIESPEELMEMVLGVNMDR